MRILISNDDGIQAKGLEALVKAFCARKHTVIVSAPARQQSGMAHALLGYTRATMVGTTSCESVTAS